MTNCNIKPVEFSPLKSKKVECSFSGGKITSDGGVVFLREIDKKLGLTTKVANIIPEYRNESYITHTILQMVRQRVYGIGLGYEDLNDHDDLRHDGAIQAAVESEQPLGSSPTLCRLENQASSREVAVEINKILVEQFIDSFSKPPKELILDFDATDDPVHGNQEGKFYHGYYQKDCFLPLHVFCGSQLLISYLRRSSEDQAKHSWAILSLLVKRFRLQWPNCKIVFRADSGFCRHKIFNWCEKNDVDYVVGIGGNQCLKKLLKKTMEESERLYNQTNEKQRLFNSFSYKAKSWKNERTVIGKAEHTDKGANPRFVVSTLKEDPKNIYDVHYCARGDMENRIKEQLLLFSDRTSCHKWWPNQLRLLFSALAYVLIERLRTIVLQGTVFAKQQVDTIRLKLFKIGGIILKNTRRITLKLSEYYPIKDTFFLIVRRLTML